MFSFCSDVVFGVFLKDTEEKEEDDEDEDDEEEEDDDDDEEEGLKLQRGMKLKACDDNNVFIFLLSMETVLCLPSYLNKQP